jgi:hypothetical protein
MEDEMRKNFVSCLIAPCLVIFVAAACRFTDNLPAIFSPRATENPATLGQPQEAESTTSASETSTTGTAPDPLGNLLQMRSVRIDLTGLRPDGTSRSIQVEIDNIGNMHLQYTLPGITIADLPEGIDLSGVRTGYQIYVINGKAYAPSESDPNWVTNPVNTDYVPVLSSQMHGLEGFTTWLDILPTGSLQAAGNETLGGFSTDKYSVNGIVDSQQITGILWYDTETHALVKAELHIPAILNSDPANPESGEFLVTLDAEKAEITPVTLPSN